MKNKNRVTLTSSTHDKRDFFLEFLRACTDSIHSKHVYNIYDDYFP